MKYRIITLIGLAGSTLAVCFGGWDKFLQTLLYSGSVVKTKI